MNRARADAALVLVAFLWGTTFVAQKIASSHVGPIFFVGVRFSLCAVFFLPFVAWEARRSHAPLVARDWQGAAWIGACLCGGCWLQQIGLEATTATNAGFMTAVYMIVVPFIAWAFLGPRPRPLVLVAALMGITGAWLMGGAGLLHWTRGDPIILLSDFLWAGHIILISHNRGMSARPILLCFLQCAITGAVSLPIALVWQPAGMEEFLGALPAIVYAGIVSSGIAFTLQIVAQRYTPPAEAALIMSLESVFAALAGMVVLQESLSLVAALGAGLILLAVVLIETGPMILEWIARVPARAALTPGGEGPPTP